MLRFSKILLPVITLAALPALAADKITPQQTEFFETKVRPVLVDQCYKCHGEKKQSGGLRMDSREAILKGGDFGPSMVPGDPDKSKIIHAIRYADQELQMPPAGKMKQADIDALTQWVKDGAPWPGDAKTVAPAAPAKEWQITPEQKKWWSIQAVKKAALPATKDKKWAKSPIDSFILARLEAAGLKPASAADRRTLIRRAYFDLIGLAPTPEEVEAFVNDKAPTAYEKVVDKLLASPQYGERWGRRWLDVARYADSNGLDENTAFGNAWRYRDYVISAFNKDKPYNDFIKEQIAGDLMPTDDPQLRNDRLTATAFMSLGPKVLAEPDKPKLAMDIVDEQIDTTSKSILGLTIACARCHDHKFDPISTKDYYAIAGIFKSTRTMQNLNTVAKVFERSLAAPEVEAQIKIKQEDVKKAQDEVKKVKDAANAELVAGWKRDLGKYVLAGWEASQQTGLFSLAETPVEANGPFRQVIETEKYNRGDFPKNFDSYGKDIGVIESGGIGTFAEWDITVPNAGDYQVELRYAAQESRPVRLKLNDQTIAENAATDATGGWNPDGQKWDVQGVFKFVAGKNVLRLEAKGAIPHIDKVFLIEAKAPTGQKPPARTLSQIAGARKLVPAVVQAWAKTLRALQSNPAFDAWDNLATASDAEFNAAAQKLTEQLNGTEDKELEPVRAALKASKGPFAVPEKVEELYPKESKERLAKVNEELKKAQEAVPEAPMTIAVEDAAKIENVKVHLRGSTLNLGDEVPRRFPTVLSTDQTPLPDNTSGRLQFAEWMVRNDHPLTSRVMVNRLWLGHFGEGLVRTPDNFGLRGEMPTHPELLDYLAATFVENGWSMKKMHRLIMLSNTYQMSSATNAAGELKDPDNKLLWRMNRRRLEAEPLRDALLQTAGQLDLAPGGTLLRAKNFDYVTNDQSNNSAQYDKPRRSIYLPVIRNAVYDFFQAFDFGDPSFVNGQRASTTIAPQALYMMNSPFVMDQARHFAENLLAQKDKSDVELLNAAYQRAYSRPPAANEVTRATSFLTRYNEKLLTVEPDAAKRRVKVWTGLCQVLLASNEFVFVN
ncbi:MAG TPA: DUF1553 domain-containing protein [Abditibacteriaceae bacterium]|jgi:hypothetical protein